MSPKLSLKSCTISCLQTACAVAFFAMSASTAFANNESITNKKPKQMAAAEKERENILGRLEIMQKQAGKREQLALAFEQEVFTSVRGKTRKSSGTLLYLKPNNFRWEVKQPRVELYVNNEKDLWKYQEATKHAQRLSPGSVDLDFIDLVLKPASLTKRYQVSAWESGQESTKTSQPTKADKQQPEINTQHPSVLESEKAYILFLALKPKEDLGQDMIYAVLNEKQSLVRELRIFYKNGNRTRIVFSEISNAQVKRETFDFVPPPGTAVDKL